MTTHFENLRDPSLGIYSVTLSSGTVLHISRGVLQHNAPSQARVFGVPGCLVLPGNVDAHGDGFEHHFMPQGRGRFPRLDRVAQCCSGTGCKLCTAFLAQSISWEDGIRWVKAAR